MARTLCCAVLLLFPTSVATASAADEYAIAAVHRSSKEPRRIYVVLATPLPAPADVGRPEVWQIRVFRPHQAPALVPVSQADPARAYSTNHTVTLLLKSAIAADSLRVEATCLLANQPTGTTAEPSVPAPAFESVDDPDDATVYFSGIVAPAGGANTLYTIDTHADVMLRRFGATGGTTLDIVGGITTDERTHVDPDSAKIGVSLQRVSGFAPVLTWDVITFEFDREARLINVLSAGSVKQTWGKAFTTTRDGATLLHSTINFQAAIGLEVGGNLRNIISLESAAADGSGTIARVVPSIGAWFVMPIRLLDRVVLSTEYTVRFPATRELFYETRGLPDEADPVPSLTKKPRHFLEAAVRFMVTKWFGVETKYKFGSLPPVFQVVDHSASFGITFMAKQNQDR